MRMRNYLWFVCFFKVFLESTFEVFFFYDIFKTFFGYFLGRVFVTF